MTDDNTQVDPNLDPTQAPVEPTQGPVAPVEPTAPEVPAEEEAPLA
jgi:hypothetical protein